MTKSAFWIVFVVVASSCLFEARFALADEPAPGDTASRADSENGIERQLAEARLKLAQLDLERAIAANKDDAIYTAATLELLRRNVAIAKARLDALSETSESSLHAAHLKELEGTLKVAELKWKNAARILENSPSLIRASLVESLRLRAEIARLELDRARAPARVATPMEHMQWQLDQLRQEVLDLNLRLEELSNPR